MMWSTWLNVWVQFSYRLNRSSDGGEINRPVCSWGPCSSTAGGQTNKRDGTCWKKKKNSLCMTRLLKISSCWSNRNRENVVGGCETFNKALALWGKPKKSNKITSARFSWTCLLQYIHFTFDLVTSRCPALTQEVIHIHPPLTCCSCNTPPPKTGVSMKTCGYHCDLLLVTTTLINKTFFFNYYYSASSS